MRHNARWPDTKLDATAARAQTGEQTAVLGLDKGFITSLWVWSARGDVIARNLTGNGIPVRFAPLNQGGPVRFTRLGQSLAGLGIDRCVERQGCAVADFIPFEPPDKGPDDAGADKDTTVARDDMDVGVGVGEQTRDSFDKCAGR
jgi:hypothetical protein